MTRLPRSAPGVVVRICTAPFDWQDLPPMMFPDGARLVVDYEHAVGASVGGTVAVMAVDGKPTLPAPSVDEVEHRLRATGPGEDMVFVRAERLRAFLEAIGPEGRAAGMAGLEVGGEHGAA